MSHPDAPAIAALNDAFRRTFDLRLGRVSLTRAVAHLSPHDKQQLLRRVQTHDTFDPDNDPYGEHDFGTVELGERRYFWKIDYYDDPSLEYGGDPHDGPVFRVLTIMEASEY